MMPNLIRSIQAAKNSGINTVLYRRLADFVVLFHCLVAAFFLCGGVLALLFPWIALIHIPLGAWVSAGFIMGWTCPLTPLENRLRKAAGSQGYEGGFVDHYFGRFVGFTPSTAGGQLTVKNGRRNEIILGIIFCIMTFVPHAANFHQYRDAIWGHHPPVMLNHP